jgi:HlyD family secretion protein
MWLLGLGSATLMVGIGWCNRSPVQPVRVARVERGALDIVASTNGTIEPVDDTIVRARRDGRIVKIVAPGTRVERGAILLALDDGPVSAELAEAQSERLVLDETLRAARAELTRVSETAAVDEDLHRQGAITRARWAEARAARENAAARLAHLEAETPLRRAGLERRIEELQAQKAATVVPAPFAGTAYRTEHKAGATVTAGEPVLRIADLDRLRVRMNVDQVDLGRVQPGQLVTVSSNAYPGRAWRARVDEIVPFVAIKDSRAVADGLAPLEPPTDGLVPGMRVDVEVLVERIADALQVPAGAIFSDAGAAFVYRVARGRARVTPVRVGRTDTHLVEVVDGLSTDDVVVLGPAAGLGDGDRIHAEAQPDRRS